MQFQLPLPLGDMVGAQQAAEAAGRGLRERERLCMTQGAATSRAAAA